MNRNHFVRQVMTTFQRDYSNHTKTDIQVKPRAKSKVPEQPAKPVRRRRVEQPRVKGLVADICLETLDPFCLTEHRGLQLTELNVMGTLITKPRSASFRMNYEDKVERWRGGEKMAVQNMTICDEREGLRKEVNSKRREFIRKSQEQSRLRYKYCSFLRSKQCSHPLRSKHNPESMPTCLTYY